jgi:hypothetical protein
MRERDFKRLVKKLDGIERNMKMAHFIQKEKMDKPKYPDLFSLERFMTACETPCTKQYECSLCDTKKRNACWTFGVKKDRKRMLIAGVPYSRIILGDFKLSDLWILASYLKIYPVFGSKSQLVDRIIKRQFELQEQDVIVSTKKGVKIKKIS